MKLKSLLFYLLLFHFGNIAYANSDLAGKFVFPYNESQAWKACDYLGWFPYGHATSHQYHMQYYAAVGKNHLGEDLNGICGADTDEEAPLFAIADGQIVFMDGTGTVSGQGKRLYVRHFVPYTHAPNDILTFDVAMLHLFDIESTVEWSGANTGTKVKKGQKIAQLGKTGTISSHLHWEIQSDLSIPLGTNPYRNPLTIKHALKYLPPSMVVDDRKNTVKISLSEPDIWHVFTMDGNGPYSTAYVELNNQRMTLESAIDTGWITSYGVIHENDDGKWYYYNDHDRNFFYDGRRYAVKTYLTGIDLHIPVPGNNFQQDRARLDMLNVVKGDDRFVSVKLDDVDVYIYNPNWGGVWELHQMAFKISNGDVYYAAQATNIANPLLRYVMFYEPDTQEWSGWQEVGLNKLY